MDRTFKIYSFGCKTSQSDALSYAGSLQQSGWRQASEVESPLLLLVQTCTVTMSADAQARQLVRKLKRENPEAKLLLTGCYAQRAEKELSEMPEIDYVIGNLNPKRWEIFSEIAQGDLTPEYPDFPIAAETARTRPYIKIQDGCDARCSYCIIPAVRGKSRSLPIEEVVKRVEALRELGYKEMIFTGISMGGYGKDLAPQTKLSELMKRVDALPGDFRIRLSSLEPEEIDKDFIDVFCNSSRFQPHLHLPLQSVSDKVLKRMRRQYLFRRYASIVDQISSRCRDLNLGTDLLVGFPDEDQEAFLETYRYVQDAPFAYCHVFPFSPRPDTPAATYRRLPACQEVNRRASELRFLAKRKNMMYRKKFVGRKLRALILQGTGEALTDNYIRVTHSGGTLPGGINTTGGVIITVRIHSVDENITRGTVVH